MIHFGIADSPHPAVFSSRLALAYLDLRRMRTSDSATTASAAAAKPASRGRVVVVVVVVVVNDDWV